MKAAIVVFHAVIFTSCAFANAAANEPINQQVGAVAIEWMMANCGLEGVPAMYAVLVPSIINGSDPQLIQMLRENMRKRIDENFTTHDAACANPKSHYSQPK